MIQMKNKQKTRLKYIFVGTSGVGKTCIYNKFVNNEFIFNTMSTIGQLISQKKTILLQTEQQIELTINDTAGQPRFKTITPKQYEKYDAIFIVFDLTNKQSLQIALNQYLKQVKQEFQINKHQRKLILVGTKQDLLHTGQFIKVKDSQKKALENGLLYFEISSKQKNNKIENMMRDVTKIIVEEINKNGKNNKEILAQSNNNLNQSDRNTEQDMSLKNFPKNQKYNQKAIPIIEKETCSVCKLIYNLFAKEKQ